MTIALAVTQSLPTEGELWRRWREHGDAAARQQLLDHFMPYARTVAAAYYGRRIVDDVGFDDYHQLACMGLVESIDRYDPDGGAQFKTFAARRMHGAILDGLEISTEKHQQIAAEQRLKREHERLEAIKAEAAERAGFSATDGENVTTGASRTDALFKYLSEVGIGLAISYLLDGTGMVDSIDQGQPHTTNHYYQQAELRQLRQRVQEMVRQLNTQERTVITRHYLQLHTIDDIASDLQLTKGRISQIHRKALQTMRTHLGRRRRCDVDL